MIDHKPKNSDAEARRHEGTKARRGKDIEAAGRDGLEPDELTWAVLLGRWVDFARSALALPDDAAGRRLRDSVADIIMLQAVWFALQHLDELPCDQRALGIDRAELLIDKHRRAIAQRWQDEPMPAMLSELITDAQQQVQTASRT